MPSDIVRLFDRAINAAQDRLKRRGQVGKILAAGGVQLTVPGKPGKVYVRLGASGEDGVIEAWPRAIPLRAHLYVKVYREDGDWIAESDTGAIAQNGSGGSAAVPPHTHRRHSGNEYISEAELFAPGVVLPSSGLTVSVGSFRYPNSTNGETYEGGTLDLTSNLPATTGKWAWLVVYVNPATNTAGVATGAEFDTQAELTRAEIDNVTVTGFIPLAAIQANESDTALTNFDRFFDARPWFVPADYTGDFLLLAGRAGGQTAYGGTASGDDLTLESTSHATKGDVLLQPNGGNVGIGGAPLASTQFEIVAQGAAAVSSMRSYRDSAVNHAAFQGFAARGTIGSEAVLNDGDNVLTFSARGWDGSAFQVVGQLLFQAQGTQSAGSTPGKFVIQTTPNSSTTPTNRLEIYRDGRFGVTGYLGEAWTAPSLNTGWANFGGAFQTAAYKKFGDLVILRGLVVRSSGAETTIFTLPSGYRPPARMVFTTTGDSALARIDIASDGTVIIAAGGVASFLSLNSIFFSTAS